MKNLLFKEFKLSFHPMCWLMLAFGTMAVFPTYPLFVGLIYSLACYSFLFLGVSKGQSTNDLFFTLMLPVRRKEAVKARLLTMTCIQLIALAILAVCSPIKLMLEANIAATEPEAVVDMGIGAAHFIIFFAMAIICYAIHDLVYVSMFYKKAKSIVPATFVGILLFTSLLAIFTIVPVAFPAFMEFAKISNTSTLIWQILILLGAIAIYFVLRIVTYNIGSKLLDKVDF